MDADTDPGLPARPTRLTGPDAGHRPPRASPPRCPIAADRPQRLAHHLLCHQHQRAGLDPGRPGGPAPAARPLRGPHPQRERHRAAQPALPRLRPEPDLAGGRRPGHQPARLDPNTGLRRIRNGPPVGTQNGSGSASSPSPDASSTPADADDSDSHAAGPGTGSPIPAGPPCKPTEPDTQSLDQDPGEPTITASATPAANAQKSAASHPRQEPSWRLVAALTSVPFSIDSASSSFVSSRPVQRLAPHGRHESRRASAPKGRFVVHTRCIIHKVAPVAAVRWASGRHLVIWPEVAAADRRAGHGHQR
jgi:hypothetical protein